MNKENAIASPRVVAWLGYGGLIPFITLTPASLLDQAHGVLWTNALLAYGAIILSFIGALHWGLAMSLPSLPDPLRAASFAWGVVPALLAWLAVIFSPIIGTTLLVLGFVAHFLQDHRLARLTTLPDWYMPLRLRLSSVAVVCLASIIFAACLK
jgi:hypothetical protein